MAEIEQIFDTIVHRYNTTHYEHQLAYHIFNSVTDSVIYELEMTNVFTDEQVSLPCFLFPGKEDPEKAILHTLELLKEFVRLTSDF